MEQTELYPSEPPRGGNETVRLAELPEVDVKVGRSFLRSVKMFGVVEPVVLADHGDDGYSIVAGKRRVKAARLLGYETVPARVFDADDVLGYADVLAVVTNEARSTNHVENFDAVGRLTAKGYSDEQIAGVTDLTVPTVRRYQALRSVHPDILAAFRLWHVKHSVVSAIERCVPRSQQQALVERLVTNGTITARDVRELAPPPAAQIGVFDGDVIADWTSASISLVREIVGRAPLGVPAKALEYLRQTIATLTGDESVSRAA